MSGAILLAACNGKDGTNGTNGNNGADGTSCKVADNHDGTFTVSCTDGTSATFSNGTNGANGDAGINGTNGTNCTVTDNGNGSSTISCTDGTSATVTNGVDAQNCAVVNNGNGTRTITCPDGTTVTVLDAVVDYSVMTAQEKKDALMSAVVTNVTIPSDGRPEVTLKVSERHGMGVKNLAPPGVSWRFALLKLNPATAAMSSEVWVSYMANNATSTASTETATTAGLTDNGDGTYLYKFTKNVTAGTADAGTTYDAAAVHRLVVLLYASGTPFAPINLVKDWVPGGLPDGGSDVTGQHEKVDQSACLECHRRFQAIPDSTGALGSGEFHGGSRYDIRTCVACHNDQRRYTTLSATTVDDSAIQANGTWTGNLAVVNGQAYIDFPVYIHKIHMGENLKLNGGTYVAFDKPWEVTFPQDIRNCAKCHRAPAPMASNFTIPGRRACGACHDDKSFLATVPPGRVAHSGGAFADDSQCTTCHRVGGMAKDVPTNHQPVSPPNANNVYLNPTSGNSNTNAASVAAAGFVPAGAKVITYDLKSFAVVSGNPQFVFRFMIASPPAAATAVVLNDKTVKTEMIDGFVGGPSAYVVYALPQDGIATPADYNVSASGYIRNIWNGTATGSGAGTLTGPDSNGYYTLTLTGVTIPAAAGMVTGGIGYTYSLGSASTNYSTNTQPFTEIDLADYPYTANLLPDAGVGYAGKGGLIVPPPDVWKVATGYTPRRVVVETARCNYCHVALGVGPDFHAGQRNDAPTCNFCHRPNQTSSAWSANQKDFIHSIHGAAKRTVPFNWHAESATAGFFDVTYPAVLNDCETCHIPGTYNFSTTAQQAALPNMLYSTVAQGRYNASPTTNPNGYFSISPYVQADNTVDYGYGYATSNVSATLPNGIDGTQGATNCTPAAPCTCTAANPCSITVSAPYTVQGVSVVFTQKIGSVTTTCNGGPVCTCTTAQPCTGVVATCSTTAPCDAQGTTLVKSPIASACSACHDTAVAIDHMQTNGASFYEARSIAFSKPQKEECLICHGPNRIADIAVVHTDKTP